MKINPAINRNSSQVIIICLIYSISTCVLFLLFIFSDAFADELITFKFNPANNTRFIETMEYTQRIEWEPSQKHSIASKSKTRYVIRKSSGGGYYVDATPIKPANIKKSDNTMGVLNSLISNLQLTYELNDIGKLLRLRGGEKSFRRLKDGLPPGMLEKLSLAIYGEPKTIEQLVANQWIQKEITGFMVGESMKLNEVYQSKLTLPFYGGSKYDVMVKIQAERFKDCGELAPFCIYLRMAMKSTDTSYLDYLGNVMRKMIIETLKMFAANEPTVDSNDLEKAISEVPYFKFTKPEITALYERVMDVETGLTREMSIKQRIHANYSINSGKESAFVIKQDTYTVYDYE